MSRLLPLVVLAFVVCSSTAWPHPLPPHPPEVPDQNAVPAATRTAHREAVAAFRADRWKDGCDVLAGVASPSDRRALTDYLEALCEARLGRIGTAEDLARRALKPAADPPSLAETHRAATRQLLAWIAAIQDAMLHEAESQLGTLPPTYPSWVNPHNLSEIKAWRQRGLSNNKAVYAAMRAKLPPASLDARLKWDELFQNLVPGHLGFIFGDFEGFPFPPPPHEVLPAAEEL